MDWWEIGTIVVVFLAGLCMQRWARNTRHMQEQILGVMQKIYAEMDLHKKEQSASLNEIQDHLFDLNQAAESILESVKDLNVRVTVVETRLEERAVAQMLQVSGGRLADGELRKARRVGRPRLSEQIK